MVTAASAPVPATREPGADAHENQVVERTELETGTESAAFEAALPRVLKIVGTVVAPTTLLTALMYYFGRLEAAAYFWYLGTQVTVLDLTVQDYLNNSVDGLIPPLAAVAGTTLLVLWIQQLLLGAIPAETRQKVLRVLMPAAAFGGFVLVGLTVTDSVVRPVFPATFLEGRGLSLSIGVLLLVCADRLLRSLIAQRRPPQMMRRVPGAVAVAEWGAVFVLVSVGLFWAVGSYAITLGISRGQQLETTLRNLTQVVAYSEKKLNLQAPGVREVPCPYPDSAYHFRYDGLKLVRQSGNHYFLLPAGWTHTNGAAILLPRSDSLRLEFISAGQAASATC